MVRPVMFPARIALFVPTVITLGALVACSPSASSATVPPKSTSSQYEVKLDTDVSSLPFEGGCLVTAPDASSQSETIKGNTPKVFTFNATSISCSYQKQNATSVRLKATVKKDGIKVKEVETEADYGIVSFAL